MARDRIESNYDPRVFGTAAVARRSPAVCRSIKRGEGGRDT